MLGTLPKAYRVTDRAYLRSMLKELERTHLLVVLVPAKRGDGMLRHADEQNPDWYRWMCANNPSTRKRKNQAPDTLIRREHVLACLRKLIDGTPTCGPNVGRLMEAMEWAQRQDRKRDEYESRHYK